VRGEPDPRPERMGMAQALRMARDLVARRPTEADAPPVSTFPLTKAAREALRLAREARKRQER
jgi:hypothetical protein